MRIINLIATFLLIGLPLSANADLISNIDGDIIGVNGVVVDNATYNVSFEEGTCASVYRTCANSSFMFTSQNSASSAVTSLASSLQAFIDGGRPIGPTNIFGCEFAEHCDINVPWQLNLSSIFDGLPRVSVESTRVDINGASQSPFSSRKTQQGDSLNASANVWAIFALNTIQDPTPEVSSPAIFALFTLCMAGLLSRQRKS